LKPDITTFETFKPMFHIKEMRIYRALPIVAGAPDDIETFAVALGPKSCNRRFRQINDEAFIERVCVQIDNHVPLL